MNVLMFAILVLAGVLAGWLAGFAMERGGYGLRWDVTLGLAGSAVATWIFWALGVAPGAGLAVVAVVAFVGAAIAIVAQRKIWPTTSMEQDERKVSLRERWSAARSTGSEERPKAQRTEGDRYLGEGRLHQKAGLGDNAR